MFLAQGVFAQESVQVLIDGQRYNCSQDGNVVDDTVSCKNASKKFLQGYKSCKETTSDYSYCHRNAYAKVKDTEKDCSDVAEACYTACKETTSDYSYCHRTCY